MPKVNPEILRWARKTAGLTLEEACQKLQISDARGISSIDRLSQLEAGEVEPTRAMLVKMSKKYHRPLITFYMSAPPHKGDRGQDFRTLPDNYSETSNALLDALIRDVQARQSIIRSVLEDEDEAEALPFVGSMKISDGAPAVLNSIKNKLNLNLAEFRIQASNSDAFTFLRTQVESIGVFVLLIGDLGSHHTAIGLDVFRGFSIADNVAPFIVINDRDSRAAWSFTLIHELVHIWLGQTGVSNTYSEKAIERFCNEIASEFLLPKNELRSLKIENGLSFEALKVEINEFAQSRNISNSMVAYNLFLTERIDRQTWTRLSKTYREMWNEKKKEDRTKAKKKGGGPDYYTVRRHRVGSNLISLVQRMTSAGALTTVKAGKVLGVKSKNVQKLIESTNKPPKSSSQPI